MKDASEAMTVVSEAGITTRHVEYPSKCVVRIGNTGLRHPTTRRGPALCGGSPWSGSSDYDIEQRHNTQQCKSLRTQ